VISVEKVNLKYADTPMLWRRLQLSSSSCPVTQRHQGLVMSEGFILAGVQNNSQVIEVYLGSEA